MTATMTKPAFNQDHIKRFQFKQLFNELGWDLPTQQQPFSIAVGTDTWLLDVVAVKKGVQVFALPAGRPRQPARLRHTPED